MDATCITDGCGNTVKIKRRKLCGPCYQRLWKAGELADEVQKGRAPANRTCSSPNCDKKHKAFDLCKQHLDEARRNGLLPADECTFEGCDRTVHIQEIGLCLSHYRQKKAGKPLTPIAKRQKREGTCKGPECDDPVQAKGFCSSHYWQFSNGRPLTPTKRITEDQRGSNCTMCVKHDGKPVRKAYTSDGLCRTHARWRSSGENYDRPIPPKAPNGAGHIDKHGYRYIQHDGRQRKEHCVFMEQLLGRPLNGRENVHHLNEHRADNRTDGPLRLVNGKLRSGNLELWSSAQPAGQEIGPKLDWALEMLEEYAEFLTTEYRERLRAVVGE